jgi:glutaredoxin-related protein
MNYNQYHFNPKQLAEMEDELDKLMRNQQDIKAFLSDFMDGTRSQEIPSDYMTFLHLLFKIYFNLDAVAALLPAIRTDVRQKTSINLLFRSVVDDIINLYYLLGTVSRGSGRRISLENELHVLHKEFLMSCEEIIRAEAKIQEYGYRYQQLEVTESPDVEVALLEMRRQNPEVYDDGKKEYRKNKAIRANSLASLKPLFEMTDYAMFLSEKQKVRFIGARGFSRSEMFTYLFKYFSQYQHYSPKAHQFHLSDALLDLKCYRWALMEVLNSIGEINRILSLNNAQEMEGKLNERIRDSIKWE